MLWLVVQEFGIAILTAIWTGVQITNRAIWKCDLSCPRQRFGKFLRFGIRDVKSLVICDLWFGAPSPPPEVAKRQLLRETPSLIFGQGRDVMDGGSAEGRGKGQSGLEELLASMQNSITQWIQAIGQKICSQGKGQGKKKAKGCGPQSGTLLRSGNPQIQEVSCVKCKARNRTTKTAPWFQIWVWQGYFWVWLQPLSSTSKSGLDHPCSNTIYVIPSHPSAASLRGWGPKVPDRTGHACLPLSSTCPTLCYWMPWSKLHVGICHAQSTGSEACCLALRFCEMSMSSAQATYQALMRSGISLSLPGGVRQAVENGS